MSVKARKIVKGLNKLEYAINASDILKPEHPLHATFRAWCKQPTKRQARKFLQKYPYYRG